MTNVIRPTYFPGAYAHLRGRTLNERAAGGAAIVDLAVGPDCAEAIAARFFLHDVMHWWLSFEEDGGWRMEHFVANYPPKQAEVIPFPARAVTADAPAAALAGEAAAGQSANAIRGRRRPIRKTPAR